MCIHSVRTSALKWPAPNKSLAEAMPTTELSKSPACFITKGPTRRVRANQDRPVFKSSYNLAAASFCNVLFCSTSLQTHFLSFTINLLGIESVSSLALYHPTPVFYTKQGIMERRIYCKIFFIFSYKQRKSHKVWLGPATGSLRNGVPQKQEQLKKVTLDAADPGLLQTLSYNICIPGWGGTGLL